MSESHEQTLRSFVETAIPFTLYSAPEKGEPGLNLDEVTADVRADMVTARERVSLFGYEETPKLRVIVEAALNEGIRRGDYIPTKVGDQTVYRLSDSSRARLERIRIRQ